MIDDLEVVKEALAQPPKAISRQVGVRAMPHSLV